jgi:aspartyl-tRNA(Asn)/glutamyl-tRNA(Gln) amidotransferase subunit B
MDAIMAELAYREPEPKSIAGAKGDWEMVIGMEVHAQVSSSAKLFSGASTTFGAEPNTNVSLVDAAMPGMLPVVNGFCLEQAVRTGLGLKAKINRFSRFDRKNYFYPDLPQGYQISQLYHPIVGEGEVIVDLGPGLARRVRIDHIHLEQDAGKSIHDLDPDLSFVDLNRTGVALMEIVSKPDIRSAEEAAEFVRKLRQILRYLGTCDGNMQEGNLRADVNVSVRPAGATELGTRCEIKNMNSMRFIMQAIEFEAKRQIALLEDGGTVEQETRLYDPNRGETRSMRSKEEAHDYRYFPDPDLLPIELEDAWIARIEASLPELPDPKKARFVADYGMTEYDAGVLTAETANASYFEAVARGRDGKQAANWVINELFGRLNKEGHGIEASPLAPAQLGGLIDLVASGEISGKIAKDVFEILWTEGGDPATIVAERGLKQVTDTGAIEAAVEAVIAANPDKVEQAKAKPSLAGWFVGQVMKATGGKANPQAVNALVRARLGID